MMDWRKCSLKSMNGAYDSTPKVISFVFIVSAFAETNVTKMAFKFEVLGPFYHIFPRIFFPVVIRFKMNEEKNNTEFLETMF